MSKSREMDKIQESSCLKPNEISWNLIVSYI
jgi:hypothetical protein